jgi:hypothetical protein
LYQLGGCAVDLPLTMTRILLTIAIVLQSLEISAWALVGGTATGHFTSRFGQLPSCSSVRLRCLSAARGKWSAKCKMGSRRGSGIRNTEVQNQPAVLY